ncbi:MAG: NAD-dependent epimerase/dehydratase family protein [Chloroflexota bacterium]|nr:MAG: NAD-dependent epimerase/dehydratase family protein [Chloroflexota bacterium]
MTEPAKARRPRSRSKRASTPDAVTPPTGEAPASDLTSPAPEVEASTTPIEAPAAVPTGVRARRRIVVTGGAGFVGSAVCRVLHERGDQVVALVRDPGRAGRLRDLASEGVELIESDLSDLNRLAADLDAADAVIHAAGSYRVGITKVERGAMWDANVGATTAVLDAAEVAHVPRIVHVSTCGVFGDTRGEVVDESFRRDLRDGFASWYDETKYGAHEVAEQRIRAGAPVVIVLPSQVYGPGDQSAVGRQLRQAAAGRLGYTVLDAVGLGFVHVDDLAAGIVATLDRGRAGEAYVLSGPTARLRQAIEVAAAVGGHAPPRLRIPTGVLRALVPIGGLIGRHGLREIVDSGAGVTYWASSAKAHHELGFSPRGLEEGFRDTFATP